MSKPRLDEKGLPEHGAAWGEGVVLRGRSRGPGVPVLVGNPHGGAPRRILSSIRGQVEIDYDGRKSRRLPNDREIPVIPDVPEGEEFVLLVEF